LKTKSEENKILSAKSREETSGRKKETRFFPILGRGLAAGYNQRIAMRNGGKENDPGTSGIEELDWFLH
jgi:hypothetical protein